MQPVVEDPVEFTLHDLLFLLSGQDRMFTVKASDRLDYELMSSIFRSGYSRIPVMDDDDPNRVVGLLFAKVMLYTSSNVTVYACS